MVSNQSRGARAIVSASAIEEWSMKSTKLLSSSAWASSEPEAMSIEIGRPLFLYHDGRPVYAVVPIDDWEKIVEALEDLEDIRALEEMRSDPSEEFLPAAMVYALLDGENPIRVWREHRGLSQQQLAASAGISKPYLSQLEAGKREASQRVIKRLAKALRVDVDDLIRAEPEDETARSSTATPAGRGP